MKTELDAVIAKIRNSADPAAAYSEAVGYITRDNDAWLAERQADADLEALAIETPAVRAAIALEVAKLKGKPKKVTGSPIM